MDSDSSYQTQNEDDIDAPDERILPPSPPRRTPQRAAKSVENSSKTTQSTRPYVLPQDRQACSQMKIDVSKRLKGAPIDSYTSLRIIKRVLELQATHLQAVAKKGAKPKGDVKPPSLRKTICDQFGITEKTFAKVVTSYFKEDRRQRAVYTSVAGEGGQQQPAVGPGKGNRTVHATRLQRTEGLRLFVQAFVREKRRNRERVTATQVLEYLIQNNRITVPVGPDGLHPPKQYESALRAVRRFLCSFEIQNEEENNEEGKENGNTSNEDGSEASGIDGGSDGDSIGDDLGRGVGPEGQGRFEV